MRRSGCWRRDKQAMPVLYALGVLLVLVAIVCGCYALRNTSDGPTRAERYLATTWLVIRRIACFSFALASLGFAVRKGVWLVSKHELLLAFGVIVAGIVVAGIASLIGVFGIARHVTGIYSRPYFPI